MSIVASPVAKGIALAAGIGTLAAARPLGTHLSHRDGIESAHTNMLYGLGEVGLPIVVGVGAFFLGRGKAGIGAGLAGVAGGFVLTFSDRSGELNDAAQGAGTLLKHYDRNHDGSIQLDPVDAAADESVVARRTGANGTPQVRSAAAMLRAADANRDGTVTLAELQPAVARVWAGLPEHHPHYSNGVLRFLHNAWVASGLPGEAHQKQDGFVNYVHDHETWRDAGGFRR